MERRQRQADPLSRALRTLAWLIYPLLAVNFFIFMGVAGEDRKPEAVAQNAQTAAQHVSSRVHPHAFLPVMVAGLLLGLAVFFIVRRVESGRPMREGAASGAAGGSWLVVRRGGPTTAHQQRRGGIFVDPAYDINSGAERPCR